VPSLLAASDVLGTGWLAAVAAEAGPGKTIAVLGDSAASHPAHLRRRDRPGRVFDHTLPLEQVADGYRAMDERRAIKTLLTL